MYPILRIKMLSDLLLLLGRHWWS